MVWIVTFFVMVWIDLPSLLVLYYLHPLCLFYIKRSTFFGLEEGPSLRNWNLPSLLVLWLRDLSFNSDAWVAWSSICARQCTWRYRSGGALARPVQVGSPSWVNDHQSNHQNPTSIAKFKCSECRNWAQPIRPLKRGRLRTAFSRSD